MNLLFKHTDRNTPFRLMRYLYPDELPPQVLALGLRDREIALKSFSGINELHRQLIEDILGSARRSERSKSTTEDVVTVLISEANKVAVRCRRNPANIIVISEFNKDIHINQATQHGDIIKHFTVYTSEYLKPEDILILYAGNNLYESTNVADGIGSCYIETCGPSFKADYVMDSIENFATCIHFKNL